MKRYNLLYLILLPFGLIINFSPILVLLNLLSFMGIVLAIISKKKLLIIFTLVMLFLQVITLAMTKSALVRQELAEEPRKTYTTDMRAFLKTYYLMKSGTNFYDAFPKGMSGWIGPNFKTDLGGWREPLPFYLWTLLPGNGELIYYLALLFIMTSILASYTIARKFLSSEKSLLVPFLLVPYFFLPLSDLTILQMEWWGLWFLLIGQAFYFHDKSLLAGTFFALSLASREIFLIPILSLLACSILLRRLKKNLPVFVPLLVFAAFYLFSYLPKLSMHQTSLLRLASFGDWHVLNVTFAYSSWNYLLGTYRPFLILFVVTTGILVFQVSKRRFYPALYFLVLYLPMFIFTLAVALRGGLTTWHDYWGIYFVPLLIIVSPIVLATFRPTSSHE